MTFMLSPELIVWLSACTIGLCTAFASLRLARKSLSAIRKRNEPYEIVEDAQHWQSDQSLLLAGWVVFMSIGIIAPFLPAPIPPRPPTLYGQTVTWMLVGAAVVWAYKTAIDYRYSRHIWNRHQGKAPPPTQEQIRASQIAARLASEKVTTVQLDAIASVGQDTNERAERIEDAVVQHDAVNTERARLTDIRLDELENEAD